MTEPAPYSPAPTWVALEPAEDAVPVLEDGQEGWAAGSGLFGAPEAGRFRPVPVVTVGGRTIQSGPGGLGDTQVAVDGVSIQWGRDSVTSQPDPATGRLQVFDLTGRWHLDRDLRALPVTIAYAGTDPATGLPVSVVYFRGRVGSPVRVARRTIRHPVTGRKITGTLVDLPLVSILVDLANRVPTVAWPAETLGARAVRLQAEAVAAGALAAVNTRDYWEVTNVAPVAANQQSSILDHLTTLYDSCGADRYTYAPNEQSVTNLIRKHLQGIRATAFLGRRPATDTYHPRAGEGVYVNSMAIAPAGGPAGVVAFVDGQALEYDPADGITKPERVTRIQLSYPDGATTDFRSVSVVMPVTGADEAVSGVRSASITSVVSQASYATLAMQDLESMVRWEGSRWLPGTLRIRSRRLDGFETVNQAGILLCGWESNTLVFLQRTYLPDMGIRPLFGVMGGTIKYEAGGWDVEVVLSPVSTDTPQHPIAWEEIDDGTAPNQVQWWDGPHPKGMHETLTLEDLRYVNVGNGLSAAGPDQGWDEYQ